MNYSNEFKELIKKSKLKILIIILEQEIQMQKF